MKKSKELRRAKGAYDEVVEWLQIVNYRLKREELLALCAKREAKAHRLRKARKQGSR